ncbi:MAG: hypothetical protein WDO13_09955 [Verrucomicrobiota bacterium]
MLRPGQGTRHSKIAREQALYSQLSASIQNVDLNKSMDQADVVIMEAASPGRPVKRNYLLWLGFGAGGGMILGSGLVFLLARLDDKINSPLDIEENFDLRLLGEIPFMRVDKKSKRVPLLAEDDNRFDFLEHHRDIRSALFFGASMETRPRSLVITSAVPGEGKSTLSANLAVTFALSGINVLLIDADMRRGILHTTFNLPLKPGLSNCLQGEVSWREVVHPTAIPTSTCSPGARSSAARATSCSLPPATTSSRKASPNTTWCSGTPRPSSPPTTRPTSAPASRACSSWRASAIPRLRWSAPRSASSRTATRASSAWCSTR